MNNLRLTYRFKTTLSYYVFHEKKMLITMSILFELKPQHYLLISTKSLYNTCIKYTKIIVLNFVFLLTSWNYNMLSDTTLYDINLLYNCLLLLLCCYLHCYLRTTVHRTTFVHLSADHCIFRPTF